MNNSSGYDVRRTARAAGRIRAEYLGPSLCQPLGARLCWRCENTEIPFS